MYKNLIISQEKNQTQSPSQTRQSNSNAKEYIEDIGPLYTGTIDFFNPKLELEQELDSLNPKHLELVRRLLRFKCYWGTQERLALEVGFCRQHVNAVLDYLVRIGLIVRNHRGVKRTCVFWLNPEIYRNKQYFLIVSRRFLLPFVALGLLLHTATNEASHQKATQGLSSTDIYISSYLNIKTSMFNNHTLSQDKGVMGLETTKQEEYLPKGDRVKPIVHQKVITQVRLRSEEKKYETLQRLKDMLPDLPPLARELFSLSE